MISQIENLVSSEAIETVLDTIIMRYREYDRLVNSERFQRLFLDEYAPHNKQFSISWAISSGFPSGAIINNELLVKKLVYSRNFTRPLLSSDSISIMVLNKTTHFKADYLNDYYAMNSEKKDNTKRFCYFKFSVDHRILTKVSLCYPNEYGGIIAEKTLINKQQIKFKIAS